MRDAQKENHHHSRGVGLEPVRPLAVVTTLTEEEHEEREKFASTTTTRQPALKRNRAGAVQPLSSLEILTVHRCCKFNRGGF